VTQVMPLSCHLAERVAHCVGTPKSRCLPSVGNICGSSLTLPNFDILLCFYYSKMSKLDRVKEESQITDLPWGAVQCDGVLWL